jgi:hypothetical protein
VPTYRVTSNQTGFKIMISLQIKMIREDEGDVIFREFLTMLFISRNNQRRIFHTVFSWSNRENLSDLMLLCNLLDTNELRNKPETMLFL